MGVPYIHQDSEWEVIELDSGTEAADWCVYVKDTDMLGFICSCGGGSGSKKVAYTIAREHNRLVQERLAKRKPKRIPRIERRG